MLMPSAQSIHVHLFVIITLVFCALETAIVANEQVIITLSDTQSVTITFPYTDYYYPTPEGCEGTHRPCNYGAWKVLKPLTVYKSRGDTSHATARLSTGDTIISQQGWLHVDRPGVVAIRDTVRYWLTGQTSKIAFPGDTLFVMQPTCETHFVVWYQNELIEIEAFWDIDPFWLRANGFRLRKSKGELLLKPELSWWIQITSSQIKEGWLRITEDQVFDGPNPSCFKFNFQ